MDSVAAAYGNIITARHYILGCSMTLKGAVRGHALPRYGIANCYNETCHACSGAGARRNLRHNTHREGTVSIILMHALKLYMQSIYNMLGRMPKSPPNAAFPTFVYIECVNAWLLQLRCPHPATEAQAPPVSLSQPQHSQQHLPPLQATRSAVNAR